MSLPAFHEVRFPVDVAFGSVGGPERATEIIRLGSGYEQRNSRWSQSRRRFNAGYGIKTLDALHEVIAFFEERRGQLFGFRFRDPLDWKSCPPGSTPAANDCKIGTGNGALANFQLTKTYGSGSTAYERMINKPVIGTVLVQVDGLAQDEGTDFTVDSATGKVSFLAGSIPANGATVKAGFEFDVPVRFDSDRLDINLAAFQAGDIPAIPVVEIKL